MVLRKFRSVSVILPFLLLSAIISPKFVAAQDLSRTIIPITSLSLKAKRNFPSSVSWSSLVPKIAPALESDFGTGFCLDPDCRFVATNYHVAAIARPHKIKGERVMQRYLATGPDDEGATTNEIFSDRPLKYTLSRDLAIFELRHPLPHHHGIAFSLRDLELDEQVDIYCFPKSANPVRDLQQFHGSFKGTTTQGFLAFEYSSANGKSIRGGASGGLVVDSESHQAVGILSRAGLGKNGKEVALAVSTKALADFVNKVQPWLAQSLFPSASRETISPASADLYPKFVRPPLADSLQHRVEEPPEVKVLRAKAQALANGMRNFVAVQTYSWGSRNNSPAAMAEYEVQVLEGFQRFRVYPDGKKELQNVPFPALNNAVVPGGEWSEFPQMVGSELHLRIHQAADAVVSGRRIKVFQYTADVEDGVCIFKSVRDYGLFEAGKIVTISCYGEVWTDENLNILRISQHLELSGKWKAYESVVTYGWLRRAGEVSRLIPLTISTQAEFKSNLYWCRGVFTNYRVFDSQSRILANDYVQSLPP